MNTTNYLDSEVDRSQQFVLRDDFELLDLMLADIQKQPSVYRPGPYWASKAKVSANEIKRCGISDFRGASNMIGLSYADNLLIDVRHSYNYGLKKFLKGITRVYPLSVLYDSQRKWTEAYAMANISYMGEILNLKNESRDLLKKYKIPYSLLGHCLKSAWIDGQEYSTHYLTLLEQHDRMASHINFSYAHSVFEIGGGFGANIHLLLENYNNIRKVLYLDIPPNLYVGTQYLKAFYGKAVLNYQELKERDSLQFSTDNKLEIFCIAPWQIERFESSADIFLNAHSFVEIPRKALANYVTCLQRLPNAENMAIALVTYNGGDLTTTLPPDELPGFFKDRSFDRFEAKTLLDSSSKNLYYLSPGKLSLNKVI